MRARTQASILPTEPAPPARARGGASAAQNFGPTPPPHGPNRLTQRGCAAPERRSAALRAGIRRSSAQAAAPPRRAATCPRLRVRDSRLGLRVRQGGIRSARGNGAARLRRARAPLRGAARRNTPQQRAGNARRRWQGMHTSKKEPSRKQESTAAARAPHEREQLAAPTPSTALLSGQSTPRGRPRTAPARPLLEGQPGCAALARGPP